MNCYYSELEKDGLLHFIGPDARDFLQGQVTCDLRNLAPQQAMPGLYCSVQGRVICDFVLSEAVQDYVLLRTRRDILESSAAVFSKYSVFSKVTVETGRDDWRIMACWGQGAAERLQAIFGAAPQSPYESCTGNGFVMVRLDSQEYFECYLHDAAADLLARLTSDFTEGDENEWHADRLRCGAARIEAQNSEAFVPQALSYDLSGHISFKKGCYTGQEVVARLHYRGKPKRRLYLAELEPGADTSQASPTVGDDLYCETSSRPIGTIVNTAHLHTGGHAILVSATQSGVDEGLRLASSEGPLLRTGTLPFAPQED